MLKQPTFVLFILLCLFSLSTYGQQQSETNLEETGIWNGLYIKARFSERFGYYAEHHYRVRNSLDDVTSYVGRPRQIYNRFGLNIFFSENFEAVIGPALVVNYSPDPGNDEYEDFTLEHRIWHQWLFKMPLTNNIKLYHQFRFEHRWKKDNDVGAEYDYTNRYRYKLFTYLPINKKEITTKSLYFSPSVEIFMHSGKSIVNNPFEDFRTYNGFGYVLNNNITLFAGHMWTLGQKSSGYEYRTSHIFRFNVFVALDVRKGKNYIPKVNLGY
ncbi:DUF2490 domain-containing protein [Aureibacter tunicatorum]|uniref:DUF2490 domain-containing protein n=1 Tax=Aureibacter tunicatorum TaxID=866807 RepID=A0AAE3XKN8_9BACT|nr:DUF2490 domain-containing protein [Aureibacter tunicatorum]MDR6237690.1 hypothetical protein [Aureibacter tunicatorum]BDD02725.1 hypothetical protein AUTU_02080 [Aureibacter tunicatorum]